MKLLHGPYHRPALYPGAIAHCLVRGRVKIIRMSDAPLVWPLCLRIRSDGRCGGHPGPVVTQELARALRTEAATAIAQALGVHPHVISIWRKKLGIDFRTPGFVEAKRAVASGFAVVVPRSREEVSRRVAASLAARAKKRGHGGAWTADEDAIVGTDTDEAIARRLGRTLAAVRDRRRDLGRAAVRNTDAIRRAQRAGRATLFGERYAMNWDALKAAAKAKGVPIATLAAWLGVAPKTIQAKHGGVRLWKAQWVREAARILETPVNSLLATPDFTRPVNTVMTRRP